MRWSIDHGDCREVLRDVADNSLDACVTDPPYELGFMGKKWDSSGVAFQVETWAEIIRVLKRGAYLLAFGGTRTYHRMACAIEDAGFEIRDQMQWLYGKGWPKSPSVLKPGHEPIVLARKPLDGTVAANVQKWGTGTLNIDGCRIGNEARPVMAHNGIENRRRSVSGGPTTGASSTGGTTTQGRWPTNIILDEEAARCVDLRAGTMIGERFRTSKDLNSKFNSKTDPLSEPSSSASTDSIDSEESKLPTLSHGDGPTISRFFYVAKASKRERNTGCAVGNNHPTVKPVILMRYLVRLVTPAGGIVLDPFCGSGTTGVAALAEGLRFAGIEQSAEYIEIARQRIEHAEREAA